MTTTEFWQTLIVHLLVAIVALGTVFHAHWNLNGLQAIVPAVAVMASALAQGFYSHSRATVKASAQAAGSTTASNPGYPAQPSHPDGSGTAPIVVQLTGIPAHVADPGAPAAGA